MAFYDTTVETSPISSELPSLDSLLKEVFASVPTNN